MDSQGGRGGFDVDLKALCEFVGVATSYRDIEGREVVADTDVLRTVLAALGVEASNDSAVKDSLRRLQGGAAQRLADACQTVVFGEPAQLRVRSELEIEYQVLREDGATASGRAEAGIIDLGVLPAGYHRLELSASGRRDVCHLLVHPAALPARGAATWGLFAPTYGLSNNQGAATLTQLGQLARWVGEHGGAVATLPLLAGFLGDEGIEVSPYRPITRQFFHELYLDPTRCMEFQALGAEQRESIASGLAGAGRWIDSTAMMKARRAALEALVAGLSEERLRQLDDFVAATPGLVDYAAFRATCEHHSAPWTDWPNAAGVSAGLGAQRVHQYAQWQLDRQLSDVADQARGGPGLYLDLPVGVHPGGFDTFARKSEFCLGLEAGAPPDALNAGGQNWALPLVHPARARDSGHAYLRQCLAAHMRHAGVLRIDHVMGFHRLFAIPAGRSARDGVYIRYPAREQWAVLCIEAHRAGCAVVGEDLGTVPDEVRKAMNDWGAAPMTVGMFNFGGDLGSTMFPTKSGSVASFGTHDTPTFAGFAAAGDIDVARELELVDDDAADEQRRGRHDLIALLGHHVAADPATEDGLRRIHDVLLSEMSSSEAWLVLITLEDLWLESEPQNVPGTGAERLNWTRQLGRSIDDVFAGDDIWRRLSAILGRRMRSVA